MLVYGTGDVNPITQLVWFDRAGKQLAILGMPVAHSHPSLSPDRKRVAVERIDSETQLPDIWMVEVSRGITSRFTFDPALDMIEVRRRISSAGQSLADYVGTRTGSQ